MRTQLPLEPTFKTICVMGRDEAQGLVNIFDCIMQDEDGYNKLENILDYKLDSALENIENVKCQLEKYIAHKKAELFQARLDAKVDDTLRLNRVWGNKDE